MSKSSTDIFDKIQFYSNTGMKDLSDNSLEGFIVCYTISHPTSVFSFVKVLDKIYWRCWQSVEFCLIWHHPRYQQEIGNVRQEHLLTMVYPHKKISFSYLIH